MQIFYIEANAEEMKANRTIIDTLSSCLNNIADKIAGISISDDTINKAISAAINSEEEEEEESEVQA